MNLLYTHFGNTLSSQLAYAKAKRKQWQALMAARPTGIKIQTRSKKPEFDLKLHYFQTLQKFFAATLGIFILTILFYPEYTPTVTMGKRTTYVVQMEHIPETTQRRRPNIPRPKEPLAVEGEEVPEDVTIESTELDLDNVSIDLQLTVGNLGPISDEPLDISEIDYKPHPIRIVAPEYPEAARRAKMEGIVTIRVLVDKEGQVETVEVLNGPEIFRKSAVDAARQFRFRPGKHEGERRKVWMIMPIEFKLK
ncbi:MAG: TonB family protein [bacterium]|nr:TonB family protein [bacterium]